MQRKKLLLSVPSRLITYHDYFPRRVESDVASRVLPAETTREKTIYFIKKEGSTAICLIKSCDPGRLVDYHSLALAAR
jgi:hypothetical protein